MNPNSLGHVNGQLFPSPTNYTQAEVCFGNHSDATFGSFAYAAPFIYVECEGNGLVALNVNTGTPAFTPCGATCGAPNWSAGGGTYGPPIVAGGAVWVARDGGGLTAFNATTGAQVFQSAAFNMNRFSTPAEAGGQVFVASKTVIRTFNMQFNFTLTPLGGILTTGPGRHRWGGVAADLERHVVAELAATGRRHHRRPGRCCLGPKPHRPVRPWHRQGPLPQVVGRNQVERLGTPWGHLDGRTWRRDARLGLARHRRPRH